MSNEKLVSTHVLSVTDCEVIVQALDALMRERSLAYEVSAKVAKLKQQASPDVADFGLPDILRLVRLVGADRPAERARKVVFDRAAIR